MGIKPFSPARLTEPEINARIGTRYFADLVRMFGGGAHYALASYNAGESRIARWRRDKPDLEQDEFIDDIPYPETQQYVRKILGTAEDYRRLYGAAGTPLDGVDKTPPVPASQAAAAPAKAPAKAAAPAKAKPKPRVAPAPKAKKPAAKPAASKR